ncbi:unnamed protein product [Auanema sp. JU1783]|nr:unnamed protein product [Auanema sp. JU1783]
MQDDRKDSNFVVLQPKIAHHHVDVDVTFNNNNDAKIYLNQDMFILSLNYESVTAKNLIIGDQIIKVNNETVNQKTFLKKLKVGENVFQVLRRLNTSPITQDRLSKIRAQRMNGFTYFIITCENSERTTPEPFGLSVKQIKNKAHVIRVDDNTIASKYFCPGDCLLDVDGHSIPYEPQDLEFHYSELYFRVGKFTVVVERAVAPETLIVYNILFNLLLPFEHDVPMGEDATVIGRVSVRLRYRYLGRIRKQRLCIEEFSKK